MIHELEAKFSFSSGDEEAILNGTWANSVMGCMFENEWWACQYNWGYELQDSEVFDRAALCPCRVLGLRRTDSDEGSEWKLLGSSSDEYISNRGLFGGDLTEAE